MVVDTDCLPEPAANSSNTLASGRSAGAGRTTRTGSGPSRTRAAGAQVLHGVGALGRSDVGRVTLERRVGDVVGQVEAVAQASRSCALVIFLIWWVALRASISGPSVQPLIVLARMTVGAPRCSVASL